MYRRIIVPLDGSELAEQALPHAIDIAASMRAPLHLIRIVDMTGVGMYDAYGLAASYVLLDQMVADEESKASEYLAARESEIKAEGIDVTTEVRRGPIGPEILAAVGEGDLIVMATHGRGGVSRWFLGSVAEEITRHSTIPVMLIRVAGTRRPGVRTEKTAAVVG